jgi:hypothetical protein
MLLDVGALLRSSLQRCLLGRWRHRSCLLLRSLLRSLL